MWPTRLPDHRARTVLISGESLKLAQSIEALGIESITTQADFRLPKPVAWHPDMQVAVLCDGTTFITKENPLSTKLRQLDILTIETAAKPENKYPKDVLCNILAWEGGTVGNPHTIDKKIMSVLDSNFVPVKQGYTACSTVLVDKHSAITADLGMANALETCNMDVLRIRPGYIQLPGYNYGLIGGCCAMIAPDQMVVAGSLENHPDGTRIQTFLAQRDIRLVELVKGPLTDVGGILSLR